VSQGWRIAIVSTVPPVVERIVPVLRELGHEPVGVVTARNPRDRPRALVFDDASAPEGLDLLFARDKWSMEPLLRALRPDLTVSWGFPWKLPQAALDVAPLGSINLHPALLPRHRGPVPLSWALRAGDSVFGVTWHRMDAELDTGGILAQGSVPIADEDFEMLEIGPKIGAEAFRLLPGVLARVEAGDPGDEQDHAAASWAGHFTDDEYAVVDWSRPAREVHNQVRAWHLTLGLSPVAAPRAELDGEIVRLARTSLSDPGNGARRVDCGDGPIWVLEHEPLP
jgi:methionyl-tRNA formyltransferase